MKYRVANFHDVESIHKIVNDYADKGLMLSRSRNSIYETLRDFVVAESGGEVVGVGALHMVWDELAEIRALAVAPEFARQGVGRTIVEQLVQTLKNGVKTVFTLTYQSEFFAKAGFRVVPKRACRKKSGKTASTAVNFPTAMKSP